MEYEDGKIVVVKLNRYVVEYSNPITCIKNESINPHYKFADSCLKCAFYNISEQVCKYKIIKLDAAYTSSGWQVCCPDCNATIRLTRRGNCCNCGKSLMLIQTDRKSEMATFAIPSDDNNKEPEVNKWRVEE